MDVGLEQLLEHAANLNLIGEMDSGSNSWAIGPERTATGKGLLAGDSHRGLDTPSVYYQNHLACDAFDVVGNSFAGVPGFPHFGHNQWVAWSVTHTAADYQDLYIELFNDADPSLYQHQEELVQRRRSRRGYPGQGRRRRASAHLGDPSRPGGGRRPRCPAMAWPCDTPPATAATRGRDILPAMLEATSVNELADAMEGWVDPVNNFVMADVHGNIGYQCRGEIPRRPGDAPAPLPVPGWDGEHEWQGGIPFEDMPRYINPAPGYIVTANNRPVGADYPYYISMDFAPGYRAMRVTHGVESISGAAANDMGRIHAERVSIPAKTYVAALAAAPVPADPATAAALAKLQNWSGSIDPGAVEPTIYSAMRDALLWRLLKHNIGEDLAAMGWQPTDRGRGVFLNRFKNLMTDAIAAGDTDLLPGGEDWNGALSTGPGGGGCVH